MNRIVKAPFLERLKIISGGQTGVDRAALDLALKYGIACGGWCPLDRSAEDGTIPQKYPLTPALSSDPAVRTSLNVRGSDATLIFLFEYTADAGTRYTLEVAKAASKAYFIVGKNTHHKDIDQWLKELDISVINIAGPRESNARGIYEKCFTFLEKLIEIGAG